MLPCCDPLLPWEVQGLISWSNGIHTELNRFYNLWSTQQKVDSHEISTLSVKLESLQDNLDHMVNCHLLPIQDVINRLSQSVLVLMGRETGSLVPLPRGCSQWVDASQPQGETGPFGASPEPVFVPTVELRTSEASERFGGEGRRSRVTDCVVGGLKGTIGDEGETHRRRAGGR